MGARAISPRYGQRDGQCDILLAHMSLNYEHGLGAALGFLEELLRVLLGIGFPLRTVIGALV